MSGDGAAHRGEARSTMQMGLFADPPIEATETPRRKPPGAPCVWISEGGHAASVLAVACRTCGAWSGQRCRPDISYRANGVAWFAFHMGRGR